MERNSRKMISSAESDVTEHQEQKEISGLLKLADNKRECGQLREARDIACEAAQIDDTHIGALQFLVNINIRLLKYEEAYYYAESLADTHPTNPLGQLMKALAQYEMKHYRDCIASSLQCLSMKYSKPKAATHLIIKSVQNILNITDEFQTSLEDMDFYSQLGEIGIVLLSANLHVLVIQILEVALQLRTGQFGVSMRIYLTQGHALYATQQHDSAQNAYENCLNMAVSTHDLSHQTKALVNIATLHLSLGETYKALVIYERLLDMHSRLFSDEEICEEIWTEEFLTGLYMNTSLAYRTIGSYDMALNYAYKYMHSMEEEDNFLGLGSIHRHIGSLYSTVSDYSKALYHYKHYLAMAKCSGEMLEIAQAYGHLGALFGQIGLWPMSIVYHDRHVSGVSSVVHAHQQSAEEVSDADCKKAAVQAYEMYGDTLMIKADYEQANNMYTIMTKYCDRSQLSRCRALYKTGNSHLQMGNSQHAMHYYDQALNLCDEEFIQLLIDIKFGIALAMQHSTSSGELEKGRMYFQQSILSFKSQIEECLEHHKFLPTELVTKLDKAFQGIQMVLAKLGCDTQCLEYAEESRMYNTRLTTHGRPFSRLPHRLDSTAMMKVVANQSAHVLYYSFLDNSLLIWMLSPNKGLARFYIKKPQQVRGNVEAELEGLVAPWLRELKEQNSRNLYKCERRTMQRGSPSESASVIAKRAKCDALNRDSSLTKLEKGRFNCRGSSNVSECSDNVTAEEDKELIGRKLYKFLVSAVDDILSKVPRGGQVIIIPDRCISQIPFHRLRDLKGTLLADKYSITYLSGIYALKLVIENMISHLQKEDEINFKRAQSSLGGYYRYLHSPELLYTNEENPELSTQPVVDRRIVSNPRLDVVLRSQDNKYRPVKSQAENLEEDNTRRLENDVNCETGRLVQLSTATDYFRRSYTFNEGSTGRLYSLPNSAASHPIEKHTNNHQRSDSAVPQPCYHRPLDGCGKASSICKLFRTDNLSTLITNSSTGTDALSSTTAVPQFAQVSNQENFVVIGNPHLSSQMVLGSSCIATPASLAHRLMMTELQSVSEILGCDYIFDKLATKQRFLEVAAKATVLHIASHASLSEGFILMSCPDSRLNTNDPIDEQYYLVTIDDITSLRMRAKLVVISGGWSVKNLDENQQSLQSLPNAFLIAGAESVLTLPHPQTSQCMITFYELFYRAFQQNSDVCTALSTAAAKISSLFDLPLFPARLYGNNVRISITEVKSAMLDQNIDEIESAVIGSCAVPPLNTPAPQKVPTLQEQLHKVQTYIGEICSLGESITDIVNSLLQLVNDGITIVEKSLLQVPNLVVLPSALMTYSPAVQLLKLLRFNFQPRGSTQQQCEPAVVFPSWDPDNLLWRVSVSLQTILDTKERKVFSAIHDTLPVQQTTVSNFIDMLALTHHSNDMQLDVNDDSVRQLWSDISCRKLLRCVGFHQIGTVLHFNATRQNQQLLQSLLKLFVMLSESKPESLLHRLDVSALGGAQKAKEKESDTETVQISTILPVLLPSDSLMRRVPWSSRIESAKEMRNKKQLSSRYSKVEEEYKKERNKLQQLQLTTAQVQADEVLRGLALPRPKQHKVKVKSGSTASKNRVAVSYVPPLLSTHFSQRRKYSEFLRKSQSEDLALRQRYDSRRCMRGYMDIVN